MVKTQLSDKWIKASILGTIWASSEIVLGSFLHNLRVPFSGNILTAIGIIILISASYKWKEHGLFWRAGIICALLKTMSPSAVIFGPFVAIISEAMILELSVRVMGRTIPGIIIGSILAMSWNLFYKVFKMILYYGNNIIDVYSNLMNFVEKQIGMEFNAVWAPLILLLVIQIIFGAVSALIGIRTGMETVNNPKPFVANNDNQTLFNKRADSNFPYSLNWLGANIIFMIAPLIIVGYIHFAIWAVLIISIATIWAFRYKRALRQLVRPRIWIYFIVITMVTAFVFTRLQSNSKSITDALLIGVEMNLRAILLIMGFSVLGTELYNPKIRDYFARSYFKQLPLALQLSLESLPVMISNTPGLRTIIKNPTLFVHHIMSFADFRLNEIESKSKIAQKVFIITGGIGIGKTSCIMSFMEKFRMKNIAISGVYSTRFTRDGNHAGYNINMISSGESIQFLRTSGDTSQKRIGSFYIDPEGLIAGEKELQNSISKIVFIDEIGKLELAEEGWFSSVEKLIQQSESHLILVVRKEVANELIDKFGIHPQFVTNITKENCNNLFELIYIAIK